MLTDISISLSPSDRARLAEIASDRNSPQKHVLRAQILLLSADGVGTNAVMRVTRLTGTSKIRLFAENAMVRPHQNPKIASLD